jgi:hypothetical protein
VPKRLVRQQTGPSQAYHGAGGSDGSDDNGGDSSSGGGGGGGGGRAAPTVKGTAREATAGAVDGGDVALSSTLRRLRQRSDVAEQSRGAAASNWRARDTLLSDSDED